MKADVHSAEFLCVNKNGEVVIKLGLYYETRNKVVYFPELTLDMDDFVRGRLLEALQQGAREKIQRALAVIQNEKARANAYRDEVNK